MQYTSIVNKSRHVNPEGLIKVLELFNAGLLAEAGYPSDMDTATKCARINFRRSAILAAIPQEIARIEASRVEMLGQAPLPVGPERFTTATTTPAEEGQYEDEESHDTLPVAKRFRGGYDLTQEIRLAEIQADARRMELEHPVRMAEAEAQALVVRQADPYFQMQRAVELVDMEILLAQKRAILEEAKAASARAAAEAAAEASKTAATTDAELARCAKEKAEAETARALIEKRAQLEQASLERDARAKEDAKVLELQVAEAKAKADAAAAEAKAKADAAAAEAKAKADIEETEAKAHAAKAGIQHEARMALEAKDAEVLRQRKEAIMDRYSRATFSERQAMRAFVRSELNELFQTTYPDSKVRSAKISNMMRTMNNYERSVYVLTNEDETKFYVGEANNIGGRIQRHIEAKGARWTRLHKLTVPMNPPVPRTGDSTVWEEACVIALVLEHGIDNVRGGSYCTPVLSPDMRRDLLRACIYKSSPPLCARCGCGSHYLSECKRKHYAKWVGGGLITEPLLT